MHQVADLLHQLRPFLILIKPLSQFIIFAFKLNLVDHGVVDPISGSIFVDLSGGPLEVDFIDGLLFEIVLKLLKESQYVLLFFTQGMRHY